MNPNGGESVVVWGTWESGMTAPNALGIDEKGPNNERICDDYMERMNE